MTNTRHLIRQQRLRYLIDTQFGGRQIVMANQTNIPQSLISRYLSGKTIGDDMKRRIEEACGLPKDWLDKSDGEEEYEEEDDMFTLIKLIVKMKREERRKLRKLYDVVAELNEETNH